MRSEYAAIEIEHVSLVNGGAPASSARFDARVLESMFVNFDAALRVQGRADLFTWTQGLLQALLPHKVLICALADDRSASFRVDSFSTLVPDAAVFGGMASSDPTLVPGLIGIWTECQFSPTACPVARLGALAGGALAHELTSVGTTELLVHGTHDAAARVQSLFLFACQAGRVGPREKYVAQLVVPFLHGAWVRSQTGGEQAGHCVAGAGGRVLTHREREILHWVYLGKSNAEVAAILSISPLTVKNHIQKILRKLNVVNRAQAVGRALDARIISSSGFSAPRATLSGTWAS